MESIDAEYLREPEDEPQRSAAEPTGSQQSDEPAESEPDFGGTQVSQGASGLQNSETSGGGADGVPDTPDDVAEPYVSETDAERRQG